MHRALETWYDAHHATTTWNEVVHRAPMPGWARALLLDGPCATDPSEHDLRDGGLMLCLTPTEPGVTPPAPAASWWSAGIALTTLNPDAWQDWAIDGGHRFSAPLAWFLRDNNQVPPSLMAAALVHPQEAWAHRWRANGWGPFQTRRPAPLPPDPKPVGWRMGPLELAALVERWDLVERWAALAPDLLPEAQALLTYRGVRPWMGEPGWPHTNRQGVPDGERAGRERVDRAWEAVVLRLSMDEVLANEGPPTAASRPRARL